MKITSKEVNFSGPAGNIQGTLDLPESILEPNFIAVNCHPHSLHGGTMTNKVIHTVSRSIAGLGVPSLRFNFRGVGKSEGEYDEGQGEQQDLSAAVDWMRQQYPETQLLLSGFSFGSFVSAFAASDLSPALLVSVAPPVKRFDFDGFSRPASPWLVIIGDEDELVDFAEVENWIQSFEEAPEFINMSGASHFFHGRLVELRQHIESHIQSYLSLEN